MIHELSARGVLFAEGHLATDDYLLAHAALGETEAITKLWSRYYSMAMVEASKRATKTAPPDKVVLRGFTRELAQARKKDPGASDFLDAWYNHIGAPPPDPTRRAISWAYYALPVRNRILVWRHLVDGWSSRKLAHTVDLAETTAPFAIDQALHQWENNINLGLGLLTITPEPDLYADPDWRTTALPGALLDSSREIITELGPRIPVEDVITPPVPW